MGLEGTYQGGTVRDIALLGKARSGKDTTAAILRDEFGYRRLAFADRLKEAALEIDPTVYVSLYGDSDMLLSHVVEHEGWDDAKSHPDVRRFLQNLGHAMRSIDPEIWIWPVLDQINANWDAGVPTVVTDCRYENEARTLREEGFTLVRIVRPGTGGDVHVSETELDGFPVDWTISNDATLEDLAHAVRELAVG